jgi:uncharacterized membrane protein (GlpM family)
VTTLRARVVGLFMVRTSFLVLVGCWLMVVRFSLFVALCLLVINNWLLVAYCLLASNIDDALIFGIIEQVIEYNVIVSCF